MAANLVIVESPAKARPSKSTWGKRFRRAGLLWSRARPGAQGRRGRSRRRLRHAIPAARTNERHVEAIAQPARVQGALPGDRPGPRRRGHRLAPEGDPQGARRARRQGRAPRGVLRDHAQRHPRGGRQAARSVARAGQRAAGAPRARLPRRLQPLAAAVEEGAPGAVRRARAEPGAAHDLKREEEIEAFKAQEYWTIEGEGAHSAQPFPLRKLLEYQGAKVEQFSSPPRPRRARSSAPSLRPRAPARPRPARCASSPSIASSAAATPHRPSPPRPSSSRLSPQLGFSPPAPCALAQQLYEGQDIGEGSVGLITYMRTDSV